MKKVKSCVLLLVATVLAMSGYAEDESVFMSRRSSRSADIARSAREQAMVFAEERGLLLGFDTEQKRVISIVTTMFEYERSLSDEDFTRKRYWAVQNALMEAAVAIPMQVSGMMEDAAVDELSREWLDARRRLDSWRLSMRNLEMVFEDDDQKWFSHLFTKTMKRDFSWKVKFGKSESQDEKNTIANLQVLGLSVIGQFESLSGDTYQVALVVSLDVGKGKEKIMSFYEGKVEEPGKMSLRQWLDEQDFGLIAGPRQYVDNKGTTWALGIVPATEGQQPYGILLDAAARDCAAFAFGGEITVSVQGKEVYRAIGDDEKESGTIDFKGIGAGDSYPRELELYFRRLYTNPLTGRKGVAAICALQSGVSRFTKEFYAQKIKKMQEEQFEKGMRAGMLDRVNELTGKLRDVREIVHGETVVSGVSRRFWKIERKLSKLTEELQEKRRLNSTRQKYFTEKIAEIGLEIAEVEQLIQKLKGGNNNE